MNTLNEEINDALLVAYLNGEDLPDKQKEYIAMWLQKPANQSLARDSYKAWELSMLAQDVPNDIDAHWEKINNVIDGQGQKQNQSNAKWWWSAAAILLISGFSYIGYFQFSAQPTTTTHLKAESTKQEYVLPDATKVVLNENAKLSYVDNQLSHSSPQRMITLIGNAYFDVSSDKEKPFIIKRADAEIQVLGTKFYVSSDKTGGTMVSVVEGSVKVNYFNSNKSFVLKPNQQIEANQDEVSEVVLNNFFWNTRKLSFQDDPLTNVFDLLSENYGVSFQLKDETIGDCLLASQFEDLDLEEVLEILSSIYHLEFDQTGNILTVTGDGCH